jgi:hypothetical protein
MNGMGVLLKGMGIDVEDILTQAHNIGGAFAAILKSQERTERMLSAICDRLEIPRDMTSAELELAASQTRLLLDQQASEASKQEDLTSESSPLPSDRPSRVSGGLQRAG